MEAATKDDAVKGTGPLKIKVAGVERVFDIDSPVLPDWVDNKTVATGGYPHNKKLDENEYEKTLERLQIELVKLQSWLYASGRRALLLFEGRDAAGKGGTIGAVRQYMSPRSARNVALTKPTETEQGQWQANDVTTADPREPTEAGVVRTYDRFAPLYDRIFGRVLEPGRKLLAQAMSALSPPSALEVGVGTGLTLSGYPAATRLVGIDFSPDMLQRAQRRALSLDIRVRLFHVL